MISGAGSAAASFSGGEDSTTGHKRPATGACDSKNKRCTATNPHISSTPHLRYRVLRSREGRPSPALCRAQSTSCRPRTSRNPVPPPNRPTEQEGVSRNDLKYDLQAITGRQSSFVITSFGTTSLTTSPRTSA